LIFLSLGTHFHAFERALDLVLPLARHHAQLVVQHGHTAPRVGIPNVRWYPYLPFEAMTSHIRASDGFICHAGVGSVLTAVTVGVVPVVIPRTVPGREHVDAHQQEFARHLHDRGVVVALLNGDSDVEAALASARTLRRRNGVPQSGQLVEVVARLLRETPPERYRRHR
jgi:UDP-N-acetylglucosamine transferase subunit ALG13